MIDTVTANSRTDHMDSTYSMFGPIQTQVVKMELCTLVGLEFDAPLHSCG